MIQVIHTLYTVESHLYNCVNAQSAGAVEYNGCMSAEG